MRTSLGIFLKAPRPGEVKTRLRDLLGAEGAASLYRAFVLDVLTLARSAPVRQPILCWAGAPPSQFLPEFAHPVADAAARWPALAQGGGDLGDRLQRVFGTFPDHPLLVLGTDSPDLPAALLQQALRALEDGARAVFGPAHDGGVWCIGLRGAPEGFFDEVPWSSDRTGEALWNRARDHALHPVRVGAWYDCDTSDDLRALATRLRSGASSATMTHEWLDRHERNDPDPNPASRS